ncbi:DUF4442 domain-containing protein [Stenotrophomonas sp. Betaine-02u-21]|uniref:DUF4442 domain-containing protein n=1 Tax=unclassified Stenotrophomonas TaxID=196198 RepID=UPI000C34C007|nr:MULTISPECIES: DUF4442 domain-containing protein [unclassified Stenotrophomonas]PKH70229.1 DUF4442 domain-containing protein [Stenotrophomonas sp. Betaine-02u-23]PKH73780.1 DUF4442 domain-containing protein [Stenotrophomonas sp. Betaine-02u-21]PKH97653.1 DUF4442 domain-containing protein [Stenotrophomonas sp. Bg11-02]
MNKHFFNAFLLSKVPIARIAGLKLHALDDQRCQIAVRLGWLNQNPFKSMFWAVEGMAAEFSTGTLCMSKIRKAGIAVSMLVANLEAGFTKKAVGKIIFTCEQGAEVDAVLRRAIETGEAQSLRLRSVGVDEQGDQVAEFFFTWSFKARVDR